MYLRLLSGGHSCRRPNGQDDAEMREAQPVPASSAMTRDASKSNLIFKSPNLLSIRPTTLPKVLMWIDFSHCCIPLMAAKRSSIVLPGTRKAL